MTDVIAIQRAFTRVCFDETPREEDLSILHADRERWLMYRSMVRERLHGMLRSGLPKTAALLGKTRFNAAVSSYLAERGPRSRYIRDVIDELVEHALPRWESDASMPAHLPDLARYEAAKWRAASLEWDAEPVRDFDFEAIPVFNPSLCTVTLRHRVDKDAEAPSTLAEPHHALCYRKPGSPRVFTYVVNDIGGRLLTAWRSGSSCADGARAVLAELGREPDARFIDGMAGVLADLLEHKILLGSRR